MPQQTDSRTEAHIRHSVTVPISAERAFDVFTAGIGAWWPHAYTWSGDVLERIGIEPREGGMCFEIGPHGFRCDWGRVLVWKPPQRIVFLWQISPRRVPEPNPEKASEVEVRFTAEGPARARVDLEHRHFEKHGEEAALYREGMDSPQGWAYILARYAAATV